MSKYFLGKRLQRPLQHDEGVPPDWGDKDNVPHDDTSARCTGTTRSASSRRTTCRCTHQIGNLHLRAPSGDQHAPRGSREVPRDGDAPLQALLQIDPVFARNYYRMAQIYMIRKQYEPRGEGLPGLPSTRSAAPRTSPCSRSPGCAHDPFLSDLRAAGPAGGPIATSARSNRLRESAETYTSMANALFMDNLFPEAERAYRIALSYDRTSTWPREPRGHLPPRPGRRPA